MEDPNLVYKTPESDLGTQNKVEIPDEILKKIKNGWVAAIVSGVMTFGIMLLALNTEALAGLYDIWSLADVALIFFLAFGIYKKSRTAAAFMFAYFLLSKIWIISETGKPSGLILSLIFLYLYFQAMVGTYQYHKLTKSPDKSMQPNADASAD